MDCYDKKLKEFVKELYSIGAIKFKDHVTKIGLVTPVYCDLRVIVSYPKLLVTLADLMILKVQNINKFDLLCGVPYTALPIATAMSIKMDAPMVMRRKEAKDYGTKKLIEGVFDSGQKCLIVEDVVTSGSSILETVKDLKEAGLTCTDAIVLLNREQGGETILADHNIRMHSLLGMMQLMEILKDAGCIEQHVLIKVRNYLNVTTVDKATITQVRESRLNLSFQARVSSAQNPVARKLFEIMCLKRTTLCIAADVLSSTDLLNLAEQVGPHICVLKTHIDILEDFHPNLIGPLQEIAKKHNFILFEDRKFADIGKTVEYQYSKGLYNISSWAQLITVHSLMGKSILNALQNSDGLDERGVFLLAETSAAESLISKSYVEETIKMTTSYPKLIAGIVCQNPLFSNKPGLIQLCPGVQLEKKEDNLGQQYNSPEIVVLEKGADIAVVGRGITQSLDPVAAAINYKTLLWKSYEKRIEKLKE